MPQGLVSPVATVPMTVGDGGAPSGSPGEVLSAWPDGDSEAAGRSREGESPEEPPGSSPEQADMPTSRHPAVSQGARRRLAAEITASW